MTVFLSVLGAVAFVVLVLVEAGHASGAKVSLFELRRRRAARDKKAEEALRREELLLQAGTLKAPLTGLLLVGLAATLVYLLGWGKGIGASVAVALLYGRIAGLGVVKKLAGRLYRKYDARVLGFVARHEKKLRFLFGRKPLSQSAMPLGSREELVHLMESSSIFSDEDKKLLESALSFNDKTVRDIMIPKNKVVTMKPGELLGPLVLDDLHKTKHEIFPVEEKGEIIGLLDIRDHTALRRRESVYVRDVMGVGVVRISQSEPLDEALRVLVAAKQPYLIVVGEDERFSGLLGLGDVIRSLTGWTRR